MSYRVNHPHLMPIHRHQRAVNDSTTPSRVYINNYTTTEISVPCFYLLRPIPPHNYHWHDHVGWPSPNHPDHCCQKPFLRWRHPFKTRKIDFVKEGYTTGKVIWEEEPEGVQTAVRISPYEKNVVDFSISAAIPECVKRPHAYRFAVHIFAPSSKKARRIQDGPTFRVVEDVVNGKNDIVYLGELVVLPAGIDTDE